jgi:hypothetical protein
LNFVVWRRDHSAFSETREPSGAAPVTVFGTTMNAQRTPVNPARLEKLRSSSAQSRAPSIS